MELRCVATREFQMEIPHFLPTTDVVGPAHSSLVHIDFCEAVWHITHWKLWRIGHVKRSLYTNKVDGKW